MLQITIDESRDGTVAERIVCYIDPAELKRRNLTEHELREVGREWIRLKIGAMVGLAIAHAFGADEDGGPSKNQSMIDDPEIRRKLQKEGSVLLKPNVHELLKDGVFYERQELQEGRIKILSRGVLNLPQFPEPSAGKTDRP